MPDPNEGLATETSGPTLEQQNAGHFAAAFEAAMGTPPTEETPAPVPAVTKATEPEKPAAPPAAEPEFPVELMTGEKPVVQTEPDELDQIQPSQKFGEQARANFDKLKNIAREARAEAARVKAELEQTKNTKPADSPSTNEALKAAQARAAELEEMVEKSNFTLSPKYREVVKEAEDALADAKTYLEGTEIDPAVIDMASRLRGPKRAAVLAEAGLDANAIALIAPHLAQVDRAEARRVQLLDNSKASQAEWQAQAIAKQEAQKAADRAEEDRVFAQSGENVSKVFEPFQHIAGADKWNAQVDRLKAEAKEFFNGALPLDKMAEIAYYGVGAKVVHQMFHAQRAELKALKEQLNKLQTAQPAAGTANGHASQNANQAPRNSDELFAQRASAFDQALGR